MKVSFTKMHGTGNDFILIDEFQRVVISRDMKEEFVRKISDRHFGVGSDGIIFVQKSAKCDVKFCFYNPDGSRAEMCGNGVRCFAKYVYERGIIKKQRMEIETPAGVVLSELLIDEGKVKQVRVDMGKPRLKRENIPVSGDPESSLIDENISINGDSFRITAVGMGNPHAVLFIDDIGAVDVLHAGEKIRFHTGLFPQGVNVHFVEKVGVNEFSIRSYERGVEDETLSCGTGVCASAVAAVLNKLADPEKAIMFHARGGDVTIEVESMGGVLSRVSLTGPAEEIFTGEIRD